MARVSKSMTMKTLAATSVGIGIGAILYHFSRAKNSACVRLQKFRETFDLSPSQIEDIAAKFSEEIEKRVRGEDGVLPFLHTFVDKLPTGKETGVIYALDLGGSNYRVVRVELFGSSVEPNITQGAWAVPESLMSKDADGEKFFDWLAARIAEFSTQEGDKGRHLPIGFTFSFPTLQTKLNDGKLLHWTKGFATQGVEGKDVIDLMQRACERAGLNTRIHACINDTVGTLMSCAYENHDCYVGLILGTGSNACYVEPRYGNEIVNIEWGGFDKMPRSKVDIDLDKITANPGRQFMEKQISGMYLGEITRRIFNIVYEDSFTRDWKFQTKYVSFILDSKIVNHKKTMEYASEIGFQGEAWTEEHSRVLRDICEMVRERSALLAATALSETIKKTKRLESQHGTISIGIDGSLYRLMPGYKEIMESVLNNRLGDAASRVTLLQSEDGSGKGAAVLVAPLL